MKRHPIDWFSLVAGLFVTAVATTALVGPWRFEVGAWLWPTLLVLVGLAVLASAVTSRRDGATVAADGGDAPTVEELDPERAAALAAAYAELDGEVPPPTGDVTLPVPDGSATATTTELDPDRD